MTTVVNATPTSPDAPDANHPAGIGKFLIGMGLALASIVMLALAQHEYGGIWPLAFVALVPLVVAQYRFMPRKLSGLPLALAWAGYWFLWSLLSLQIAPWPTPLLAAGLFFAIGLLVASFDRRFSERTGYRWFLLTLPVSWVAFDMVFWGNLAVGGEGHYAQLVAPFSFMLSPLSLLGECSLTFLLVLINCAIALVIIAAMDRRKAPEDSVPVSSAVMQRTWISTVILIAVWFISAGILFSQTRAQQGTPAKVAAVQIGPGDGYDAAGAGKPTDGLKPHLAAMTRKAALQGAKYVVWGEVILRFDPREDRSGFVQNLARDNRVYIQAGFSTGTGETASNIVGLWDPAGNLVGVYYKIHPVVMAGEGFIQPKRYPVFDTSIGTVGMIICFDFSFEDPTRYLVQNGANVLSASVGDWTEFAPTRIATLQIRAAENRVPYIKGESFNGSALIDATGTVISSADMGSAGGESLLIGDIQPGPRNAVYTSIGPVFGYLCVLGVLARIVAQIVLWRRARRVS